MIPVDNSQVGDLYGLQKLGNNCFCCFALGWLVIAPLALLFAKRCSTILASWAGINAFGAWITTEGSLCGGPGGDVVNGYSGPWMWCWAPVRLHATLVYGVLALMIASSIFSITATIRGYRTLPSEGPASRLGERPIRLALWVVLWVGAMAIAIFFLNLYFTYHRL